MADTGRDHVVSWMMFVGRLVGVGGMNCRWGLHWQGLLESLTHPSGQRGKKKNPHSLYSEDRNPQGVQISEAFA